MGVQPQIAQDEKDKQRDVAHGKRRKWYTRLYDSDLMSDLMRREFPEAWKPPVQQVIEHDQSPPRQPPAVIAPVIADETAVASSNDKEAGAASGDNDPLVANEPDADPIQDGAMIHVPGAPASHPQPNKKRRPLHQSVKPPDKKKARGEEATAEKGDEIKNNEELNPVPPPERSELEGKLQALSTEEGPSEQQLENLRRAQKKYRDMVRTQAEIMSKKEGFNRDIRYGVSKWSTPETEIQEMIAKRTVLNERRKEVEATRRPTTSELENIRKEVTGIETVSSRGDPVEWGTRTPVTTDDEDEEDDSEEEISD